MKMKSLAMLSFAAFLALNQHAQAAAGPVMAEQWEVNTKALKTPFAQKLYGNMCTVQSTIANMDINLKKSAANQTAVLGAFRALVQTVSGGDNAPAASEEEFKLFMTSALTLSNLLKIWNPASNPASNKVDLRTALGFNDSANHKFMEAILLGDSVDQENEGAELKGYALNQGFSVTHKDSMHARFATLLGGVVPATQFGTWAKNYYTTYIVPTREKIDTAYLYPLMGKGPLAKVVVDRYGLDIDEAGFLSDHNLRATVGFAMGNYFVKNRVPLF